jgi:hypothetical protein
MSELETILLIVGAFYLTECMRWLRPGSLLFRSHAGARHRLLTLRSGALLTNPWGGVLLGNLFPWGSSTIAQFWPISLSASGICSWVPRPIGPDGPPEQPRRYVRFLDINSVTVESTQVHINDRLFVTTASAELARFVAATITRLARLSAQQREAEITSLLTELLDHERVTTRFREATRLSLGLAVACTGLFAYLFVMIPTVLALGLPLQLWRGLLIYILLWVLTAYLYVDAAWQLLPGTRVMGRVGFMLIAPADAMHARRIILSDVLSRYHPLAIARALCPPAVYRDLAGQIFRDLLHPTPADPDARLLPEDDPKSEAEARVTLAWFAERLTQALRTNFTQAGIDEAEVTRQPVPDEPAARTWCPRCHDQYILESGVCSRCQVTLCRLVDQDSGCTTPPRQDRTDPQSAPRKTSRKRRRKGGRR